MRKSELKRKLDWATLQGGALEISRSPEEKEGEGRDLEAVHIQIFKLSPLSFQFYQVALTKSHLKLQSVGLRREGI